MRTAFSWVSVLGRLVGGGIAGMLFAGLCFGPLTGFAISCLIGLVNPLLGSVGQEPLMLFSYALFSLPGAAVGGACGAIKERPLIGSLAGFLAGILAISPILVMLVRYDDSSSWALDLPLIGLPTILASTLAGACVGAKYASGEAGSEECSHISE